MARAPDVSSRRRPPCAYDVSRRRPWRPGGKLGPSRPARAIYSQQHYGNARTGGSRLSPHPGYTYVCCSTLTLSMAVQKYLCTCTTYTEHMTRTLSHTRWRAQRTYASGGRLTVGVLCGVHSETGGHSLGRPSGIRSVRFFPATALDRRTWRDDACVRYRAQTALKGSS